MLTTNPRGYVLNGMGTGKTKPSDVTLTNLRGLRAVPDAAAPADEETDAEPPADEATFRVNAPVVLFPMQYKPELGKNKVILADRAPMTSIRKFFASIDQGMLMRIVGRHIPEREMLWLLQKVVGSSRSKSRAFCYFFSSFFTRKIF